MSAAPGWIQRHRSTLSGSKICITGGFISAMGEKGETYEANEKAFVLDVRSLEWR
jgi:hypothetical protein